MSRSLASAPFVPASIELTASKAAKHLVRTVPELIQFNALHNPDHLFCIQAKKAQEESNPAFLNITFAQLKQAILRCSAWLVANIAELLLPHEDSTDKIVRGPPIALFVDSNVGLLIYQYALMALGVPVLLLSARLSPTAISHLLLETAAQAIIVSPRLKGTVTEALSTNGSSNNALALYVQSPYGGFLSSEDIHYLPKERLYVPRHFISEEDRNVLILHSSGTTGLPKPIYTSHRYSLSFSACHAFLSNKEAQSLTVSTLPLYHGFGLLTPGLSLGVGMTFCLPISAMIPTGSSTLDLLVRIGAKSLLTVPSVLEEILLLPDRKGILTLQPLQFVAFGGGLLKPSVGARLETSGIKLLNHYGATEVGPLSPIFVPTPEYDWRYFRLRDDIRKPLELRLDAHPIAEDGVQRYKLSLRPLGWVERFEVQDLLISNPQKPELEFSAVGRNDDMIVLATGEKVIPRILESMLSQSELVKAALAFGDGQFEIGVLVEPMLQLAPHKIEDFRLSIWPIIQDANRQMDGQSWISSPKAILVVEPNSIPRADKGSLLRREAIKLFEEEIKETYMNLDAIVDSATPLDMNALEHSLKQLIQNRLKWKVPDEEWNYGDDLFDLGMDSLQATQLRRLLLASLPREQNQPGIQSKINREFVYQYSLVKQLAYAVKKLDRSDALQTNHEDIDKLVEFYSVKPSIKIGRSNGCVVLVTGSTGSLGSYVLAYLVDLPDVTRVICLNRPSKQNPYLRQKEALKKKRICLSQDAWDKIEIHQTNSAANMLGLQNDQYVSLQKQLTHIVHTAWPMDFNRLLPSFASQFQSLQNVLELARDVHASNPAAKPRVVFVSSIAAVGRYHDIHGEHIVPEVLLPSGDCTMELGYAKAKLICERIMDRASHDYPNEVEAVCVRFGQIAGAQSTGYWNPNEHVAALIKSSELIGKLPYLRGTHSWLPVDRAAHTLMDLLFDPAYRGTMYHVENPIRQSWRDTLEIFASNLMLSDADYMPFNKWLKEVCARESEGNPAKNLAEFFEHDFERMSCGKLILGTELARKVSSTLRRSTAVSKETIESYVKQWRAAGFLSQEPHQFRQ